MILFFAGEDCAHFELGTSIAARVLQEHVEWVDPSHLTWRPVPFRDAMRLAREAGIRTSGSFGGAPGLLEARAYRPLLLYWNSLAKDLRRRGEDVVGGVILRDEDRLSERRTGAEQARSSAVPSYAVALGFCVPEAEGWYLCAFEPENEDERTRLAEKAESLGFDPRRGLERLTSTVQNSDRDAKKILQALMADTSERRARCLELPLDRLRELGGASGLAAFILEVEHRIVPALRARPIS